MGTLNSCGSLGSEGIGVEGSGFVNGTIPIWDSTGYVLSKLNLGCVLPSLSFAALIVVGRSNQLVASFAFVSIWCGEKVTLLRLYSVSVLFYFYTIPASCRSRPTCHTRSSSASRSQGREPWSHLRDRT